MLENTGSYESLYDRFEWDIPEFFNIGYSACTHWARKAPERPAIITRTPDKTTNITTYGQLEALSNRICNLLTQKGIARGDRVAILLPQMPETCAIHMAIYKLGAIALPLAMLFGSDGLAYRLDNSGASILFLTSASADKTANIIDRDQCIFIDSKDFTEQLNRQSDEFASIKTRHDDPALMIYTSGTTGPPKGALHSHQILLGHIPGVQFAHDFLPQPDDMLWTPADWAWAGGLLNVMLPALYLGVPVVACKFDKFDAEQAWDLLSSLPIRNIFIPPTALKIMRASPPDPEQKANLQLRTLFSGGEAVGRQLQGWAMDELGLHINEVYGQTECNLVLESCASLDVLKPGAIGKPVPGHKLAIIDNQGNELANNAIGTIAIKRPDPVMFLRYWDNEQATTDKFCGDWLLTGDQGYRDDDGYYHFTGRDDDMITSSGYRIGPGEIEDCLLGHPAIKLAAVTGRDDPVRTQIVVAHLVLHDGFDPSDQLAQDIQNFVKTRLAAHEYPRKIRFLDDMPLTTTGKIIRRHLR